jgi:THO complex subunit 5
MAPQAIVTDPSLLTVLSTSSHAREQAIALLDLVASLTSPGVPPTPDALIRISKQQKLLYGYLAQLRGLHRDAVFGGRDTKGETTGARQEVDKLHLQLQNLYYEQRHLQGEISACESYEYVASVHLLHPLLPGMFCHLVSYWC